MNRRLYRCTHDRKIAGVASGLAEYFDADPTLVRLLWFVSIFFGGLGLFLYIAMAIIVPNEPYAVTPSDTDAAPGAPVEYQGHRHATRGDGRWTTFLGLALVLFGSLALVDAFVPAWEDAYRYLVPAFIIGIGALLVASALRREPADATEGRESMET
jgi:phage shock protein PspC (stress-responsive transcriptional regulator)